MTKPTGDTDISPCSLSGRNEKTCGFYPMVHHRRFLQICVVSTQEETIFLGCGFQAGADWRNDTDDPE